MYVGPVAEGMITTTLKLRPLTHGFHPWVTCWINDNDNNNNKLPVSQLLLTIVQLRRIRRSLDSVFLPPPLADSRETSSPVDIANQRIDEQQFVPFSK
jgi:hypothetical protein